MLHSKKQILIADDELNIRRVLEAQLTREGYEVQSVEDGLLALEWLKENHVDLLISDLKMPGLDGMELMRATHALDPEIPLVMITAHGTVDNAVQALKSGAFDYLQKPFDQTELLTVVAKALKTRDLSSNVAHASPSARAPHGILGKSDAVMKVFSMMERGADTPTTVLVTGESGTGKEVVARALHVTSKRAERPFIRVNCAAIPRELLESEFFGHEKDTQGGGSSSKPGRFELAEGGTLFLDEIDSIPLEVQVKLLRVLQDGEFERVGGVRTLSSNIRLVAATNADLGKMIEAGQFREDLYYRLNVVHLRLPALRERGGDIPLLVEHFLEKYNQKLGRAMTGLSAEVQHVFSAYSWPGNVRELENVLERAVLFAEGSLVETEHLPPEMMRDVGLLTSDRVEPMQSGESLEVGLKEQVRAAVNALERRLISKALEQNEQNVTHTARFLKLSRKGLQLKMKELDLRDKVKSDRPGPTESQNGETNTGSTGSMR
ncbi:MAG: sigma-54 dependent transcriptional regulator [Polyangiaceae bacterium]|nr:sigma-54 dependent transcriptional regulator [Polyangiaceae bacterium]